MGRCWTPSQRTPVQYSADGSTCSPSGLGVPISKVGTVCVSSASTGLCGGQRVNRCPYRDPGPEGTPDSSGRALVRARQASR
jgi:hypothetical protein